MSSTGRLVRLDICSSAAFNILQRLRYADQVQTCMLSSLGASLVTPLASSPANSALAAFKSALNSRTGIIRNNCATMATAVLAVVAKADVLLFKRLKSSDPELLIEVSQLTDIAGVVQEIFSHFKIASDDTFICAVDSDGHSMRVQLQSQLDQIAKWLMHGRVGDPPRSFQNESQKFSISMDVAAKPRKPRCSAQQAAASSGTAAALQEDHFHSSCNAACAK
jgi:hypothetical protein